VFSCFHRHWTAGTLAAGRVGAAFRKGVACDSLQVYWRMSVVHYFQHPSEGVDGCTLVHHSDSMLGVVVCNALCPGSPLVACEVVSFLHCTVDGDMNELLRTALNQRRCADSTPKRARRHPRIPGRPCAKLGISRGIRVARKRGKPQGPFGCA
jgi:hypothetical protein